MRIIFFGSADFACPSLSALIKSKHKIEAIITQPDRPKGRGQQLCSSRAKSLGIEGGLRIEQPQKASGPQTLELIKDLAPDIIVVVAYGQILSRALLAIPRYGGINVHGSLLPKYRGAAPINQAIIEGEKNTGITIIQMDEGMDTGDIILQREIEIAADETANTLSEKLALMGAEMLIEALELYEKGQVVRKKQNHEQATYTKILKKEDGLINFSLTAEKIVRLIRGLNPWPGTFSYFNGQIIKLLEAKAVEQKAIEALDHQEKAKLEDLQHIHLQQPGQIIGISRENGLLVRTGMDTVLGILRLKPENKRAMSAWDYAQGIGIQRIKGRVLGI